MFRAAKNGQNVCHTFRKLLNESLVLKKQLVQIRSSHVGIPFSSISFTDYKIFSHRPRMHLKCCSFSTDGPSSEPGSGDHSENNEVTEVTHNMEYSEEDRSMLEDSSESDAVQVNQNDESDALENGRDETDSPATWIEDDGIVIYTDKEFLTKRQQKNLQRSRQQPVKEEDSATENDRDQFNLRSLLQNIQRQRDEQEKKEQRPPRTSVMGVEELVDFLKEDSAMDICVIAVPPEMDYVEHFVVCSGTGSRHIGRMADHLEEEMRLVKLGPRGRRIRVEGRKSHEWMAVDLGTMVVHFMTESKRREMELEKLWTLGEKYDDQSRALARNYDQVMEMELKSK